MQTIYQQFVHPTGLLGRFIGWIMSIENRQRIEWTIDRLNPQSDDHILEIGFGPGLGIELLVQRISDGLIAGVDHSNVMVEQASNRNRDAVQRGLVDLRQGSAEHIPFEDSQFDTVFAINSYHLWNNQSAGLREVARVLKSGGKLVIIEQPPERVHEASLMQTRADVIAKEMTQAGYTSVTVHIENLNRGWTAFITGFCAQAP